jgi:hypothetical protein
VTVINTHLMKALADERAADLRREIAPQPRATSNATPPRRLKRSAKRTRTASAVQAEQR